MHNSNDWRITDQEDYLKNALLVRKQYKAPTPTWDHDHCSFCWDRFSEYEGSLHEGYCTTDGNHWICDTCFVDFKDMFGFQVLDDEDSGKEGRQNGYSRV